jgi:hypothetical protein
MNLFFKDRGEVSQLIDHEYRKTAKNGREVDTLCVQVEWGTSGQQTFSWEPVS